MKTLSFKAIFISILFLYLVNLVIGGALFEATHSKQLVFVSGLLVQVASGFIAGYLAKRREWLHGLISGAIAFLLPVLLFYSVVAIFVLVLHAEWDYTNGPPSTLWKGFFEIVPIVIPSALTSGIGGYLAGVVLRRKRPKNGRSISKS